MWHIQKTYEKHKTVLNNIEWKSLKYSDRL